MSPPKKYLGLNILQEVNHALVTAFPAMLETEALKLSASEGFSLRYQADSYLSKYISWDTDPPAVRRDRAIVKWLGVELRNSGTNTRLFNTDPIFNGIGTGWQVLTHAQKLVRKVLGEEPPEDILSRGSFSSGASTSRGRMTGSLFTKFMGSKHSTFSCLKAFAKTASELETWFLLDPGLRDTRIVKGNVLFTVPKTAVIDRVAAKEPDLNIFCQKAVGDFIRHRLKKRVRIDLNDQSINRSLALRGSIDGKLSTIDLSSASDSLTDSLVNILLPPSWYKLLDSVRCHITNIDGTSHVNEMFSSMGNGFTFELESLVFWALAQSTCYLSGTRGRVSVYGDDIVIPSRIAPAFIHVLNWTGFKVNVKKTFTSGPFRESCGGHYYLGLDVTPFYLKAPVKDLSDLILVLNKLRSWIVRVEADSLNEGWTTENVFVRFWLSLSRYVPMSLWGGYDGASRTQLATPGLQKCKLKPVVYRKRVLEEAFQTGMYLSRLSVMDRSSARPPVNYLKEKFEGRSGSEITIPTGDYIFVKVANQRDWCDPRVFGLVAPLFLTEQLFPLESGHEVAVLLARGGDRKSVV